MFQSAPRSFDRSVAKNSEAVPHHGQRFQSAPRSFDRSVARIVISYSLQSCFNPHPGPSTGVSMEDVAGAAGRMFQSAPRSFDRSVTHSTRCSQGLIRFNPHPGPSTGVSFGDPADITRRRVSIRTPVLRPECLCHGRRRWLRAFVSIRTPVLRPECRSTCARMTPAGCLFQSAPRSFDRSVSRASQQRLNYLFQSAPRSFDRSVTAPASAARNFCFNPHPGPSTGVSESGNTSILPQTGCFNPHPGPSTGVSRAGMPHCPR